jgi:HK97 family phage portal protein
MGLWDVFKQFFTGKKGLTLKRPDGWPGYTDVDLYGGMPAVNDQSSLKSSAYFSSLIVICNTVSILPKTVHRRTDTGSEKDKSHDQYRLINKRANPYQSSSSFWKEFSFNRKHRGNGTAWLEGVDTRAGRPIAYWNLNPNKVEIDFQGTDLMWRYLDKLPDKRKVEGWRHYRELLHVPNDVGVFGSMGGLWGQPTINFAAESIQLDLLAERSTSSYLKNNGIVRQYFKHPMNLTKEQRSQLAAQLKEYGTGGARENQKPLLDGGMSLESVNANLADVDMDSLRRLSLETEARFNTFPALFKIAHHDRSNFANAYQAAIEFVTVSMLPITQAYQEELDYKVLRSSEEDTHFVNFEYKTLLQAEPDKQAEFLRSVFNMGGVKPNTIAELLDMPTMGDSGEETYIMNNMIPTRLVDEYWRSIMNKAGQMTPERAASIINEASKNGVHNGVGN